MAPPALLPNPRVQDGPLCPAAHLPLSGQTPGTWPGAAVTDRAAGASPTLLGGATFPTTQDDSAPSRPRGTSGHPLTWELSQSGPPSRIRSVASGVRIGLGVYLGLTLFGECDNQNAHPPPSPQKHLSLL